MRPSRSKTWKRKQEEARYAGRRFSSYRVYDNYPPSISSSKRDSVSFPYPEGMQSRVAGDLRLTGSPERYLLSGEIRLLEGLYQREITLETELLGAIERHGVRVVRPETGVVQLDIAARTVEDFQIENTLAQMAAGANLRITGTLSEPELDGVLTARPEGTFRLGRNRYTIDSGTVAASRLPSPTGRARHYREHFGLEHRNQSSNPGPYRQCRAYARSSGTR